jgi:hypothetical protein
MQIAASAAADRRRHPRYSLYERARLRPNDWSTVQIALRDISCQGFRGECEANLKIGGFVMLEVNGIGQVEAKIMWRRNEEIGAQFARPIMLDHCGWMREKLRAVSNETDERLEDSLIEQLARRAARRAAEL